MLSGVSPLFLLLGIFILTHPLAKDNLFLQVKSSQFGSEVIGESVPSDVRSSNQVFNRTGKMFNKSFNHAKNLGVKTAVGTELPMGLEPKVPEVDYELLYE